MENQLVNKLSEVNKNMKDTELDAKFNELAKYIMRNYCISINDKKYFMNEIEFYFYGNNYPDLRENSNKTVTYQRSSNAGEWFFHEYGVDLTFKSINNDTEKYGGGILIRSVEDENGKPTIGPINCINEIWPKTVSAFKKNSPNPIIKQEHRDVEINVPTPRVRGGKTFADKRLWRFTVKGKKVTPIKE